MNSRNAFTEYSFVQKETDREINSKGEVKKETVKVFEVFPIANRAAGNEIDQREWSSALGRTRGKRDRSELKKNLRRLNAIRIRTQQRVEKHRAERERKKAARAKRRRRDDDVEISQFLKVHEFVSPRRERFRDREAVVFDFRVRPGFKSEQSSGESDFKTRRRGLDRSGRQAGDAARSEAG